MNVNVFTKERKKRKKNRQIAADIPKKNKCKNKKNNIIKSDNMLKLCSSFADLWCLDISFPVHYQNTLPLLVGSPL